MSDPTWGELVKQDRLDEMYETFRKRPEATDKEVAFRLARFAEARMRNAADRQIVELTKTAQGWQCPVCSSVLAPRVDRCECQKRKMRVVLAPSLAIDLGE